MRKQLKTKKRLDGNTFMEMYLGFLNTSLCLLQLLVPAPNYLHCECSFIQQ